MTSNILVMLLAVFSMWNVADAHTGESVVMRIYDRNFQVSDTKMRLMLDKAALEEHGFKLEVISKLTTGTGTGSDKPVYHKAYFYYKTVDCSQVPEVNEELESLIPGIFGSNILAKVRGELKTRNLDHLKKCQTGLEVHFKEAEGCYEKRKVRALRRDHCRWCIDCSRTNVLMDN